ncbi:hypothetical protein D3C71_1981740 [compost metagenome]
MDRPENINDSNRKLQQRLLVRHLLRHNPLQRPAADILQHHDIGAVLLLQPVGCDDTRYFFTKLLKELVFLLKPHHCFCSAKL